MNKVNVVARLLLSLVFVLVSLIGWWLAGFDFNERGADALGCFLICLVVFFTGITCPIFDKDNK